MLDKYITQVIQNTNIKLQNSTNKNIYNLYSEFIQKLIIECNYTSYKDLFIITTIYQTKSSISILTNNIVLNFFKEFIKIKNTLLRKFIKNPTTLVNKKFRVHIEYKKWKNFKWLYKARKKTKKSTYLQQFKLKLLNKTRNTKLNASIMISKNKLNFYKNAKFVTKNNLRNLFMSFKQTNKGMLITKSVTTESIKHKIILMSCLLNYIVNNITKKKFFKKIKKVFKAKQGIFIKRKFFFGLHAKKNEKTLIKPSTLLSFTKLYKLTKFKMNRLYFNSAKVTYKNQTYMHKNIFFKTIFLKNFWKNSISTLTLNLFQSNMPLVFLEQWSKYNTINNKTIFPKLLLNSIKTSNQNVNNNYTPLVNYTGNVTKYRLLDYQNKPMYNFFYVHFLMNFLEKFLRKKLWCRVDTRSFLDVFWKNHINLFIKHNDHLYRKLNKILSAQKFVEIIILTAKKQDLQILLLFIKTCLENSHFKNHKKILSMIFDILKKNKIVFDILGIKGFSFDIRGKVGVSGNAKKRHLFFSIGKISTTSQYLKSQWQQVNVWTPTGQMGITCLIQY